LTISIDDSSTRYSAPSWSTGIARPVLASAFLRTLATAGHFSPIGPPISMVRLVALLMPSGTWPDTAMPSRNLRIM